MRGKRKGEEDCDSGTNEMGILNRSIKCMTDVILFYV